MPNVHKHPPIAYRPGPNREWLLSHAAETGKPVNAIINEAVDEYRLHRSFSGKAVIRKDGDPLNNDPANLEIREG